MAHILYIGDDDANATSAHRAQALRRLGHAVTIANPELAATGWLAWARLGPLHYRTGYRLLQVQVARWLTQVINRTGQPAAVWIDSGELVGPKCLRILRGLGCPLVLYNVDDPTGHRDGHRFDSLLQALPLYDLVVVVRQETEQECKAFGAQRVLRVLRSYDEVAHSPFARAEDIPPHFHSDVIFIGTWMRHEKRDEFLLALLKRGVPVNIWGDRWKKSPHWPALEHVYRGGALGGREYVAAIQGAKLCLGLLSKGNRDLHTQRSLEVPFAGGILCAERTAEHQEIYQEGVEAVFWSSAGESAQVCLDLLADEGRRERIRAAGMRKVRELKAGNEDVCRQVLGAINIR